VRGEWKSGAQDHGRRISGSPSTAGLLDSPERRARPARTFGGVAEWLGKGLQNPVHRFNSGPRLGRSGPSGSIEARTRALSSGVERFLDAEEVRGSNPLAPTRTRWSAPYSPFHRGYACALPPAGVAGVTATVSRARLAWTAKARPVLAERGRTTVARLPASDAA
jgi:hypothetical protein